MSRRLLKRSKKVGRLGKLAKNEEDQILKVIKNSSGENAGEVFYKMGKYYDEGLLNIKSKEHAIRFYNLAIDENYQDAFEALINLYYDDDNFLKVNELCLRLYNKDNSNISAIKTLINIYVEHNYEHENDFLEELIDKAIELNDNDSMINKAIIIFKNYEALDENERNNEEKQYGIELLERCIENDYAYAFYIKAKIIDTIIFDEEYKEQDRFELYKNGIKKGTTFGYYDLGCYYESNDYNFIEQSYSKAYNYFVDGWKNNDYCCALKIADYYNNGYHVKRNIKKALDYYLIAFDGLNKKNTKHLNLFFNIGHIYYEKKDYENAFKYFEEGRKHKCKHCYLMCGLLYKYGYFVNRNLRIAYEFIKKSIELGNDVGLYDLAVLEYELNRNVEEALLLLNRCKQNNINDINYLYGHIYINEFEDYKKGFEYYTKGIEDYNCCQCHLGAALLYYYGKGVERDINKSLIHFLICYEKSTHISDFVDFIHFIPLLYVKTNRINKQEITNFLLEGIKLGNEESLYYLMIFVKFTNIISYNKKKLIKMFRKELNNNKYLCFLKVYMMLFNDNTNHDTIYNFINEFTTKFELTQADIINHIQDIFYVIHDVDMKTDRMNNYELGKKMYDYSYIFSNFVLFDTMTETNSLLLNSCAIKFGYTDIIDETILFIEMYSVFNTNDLIEIYDIFKDVNQDITNTIINKLNSNDYTKNELNGEIYKILNDELFNILINNGYDDHELINKMNFFKNLDFKN